MAEVLVAAPILSACWKIATTIRTVGERISEAREGGRALKVSCPETTGNTRTRTRKRAC
jgi:hypothetical protein